jgi:glycosyltransferase involved in cell wall biosynthesis
MSRQTCAPCFEEAAYFTEVLELTEQRLEAVRAMARVTVLSRYMEDELVAVGVPARRIEVIPPFVHGLDPLAQADGPPCILFAGRLAEAKGVSDAVAAWHAAGTGLPLVFAGTGPLRAALERDGFEVLGWLDRLQMSRAFRRARALLMPSLWHEPFGIVGLEALSMGVPVVAYDSGGVRDWHPGEGLVPWGDVGALASALREAVGRRPGPAKGFEAEDLMRRLVRVYEAARASA